MSALVTVGHQKRSMCSKELRRLADFRCRALKSNGKSPVGCVYILGGRALPDADFADKMTDHRLLECYARTGDAEAFRDLVERYQNLVWSVCRRKLRNDSDAEDVVQDVFLLLAKNASKINRNLATWLHTNAVNRSTTIIRTEKARRDREQQHIIAPVKDEDHHAWQEMRDVIDECLSQLSEDQRELIIQRFFRGKTQLEIARYNHQRDPRVHNQWQLVPILTLGSKME